MQRISSFKWLACLLILCAGGTLQAAEPQWTFEIQFSPQVQSEAFTGTVSLFTAPGGSVAEPRFGPNWFHPAPFLSQQVTRLHPGETVTLALSTAKHFPVSLRDEQLDGLQVQAVARFNPLDPEVGTGVGNGFSQVVTLSGSDAGPNRVALRISELVPERKFPETDRIRLLRVRSHKLSTFLGREVFIQGAVTLPASYSSRPGQRYPVILEVPGFGGDHFLAFQRTDEPRAGVEFIRVMLDPRCPLGHHVFANSDNNGPWGEALVAEFLPALDDTFRTVGTPAGRFLTGHSSGGWSTLWLQVNYPDDFGGTWSTAPDPVDFRDFQQIDLYRPGENMFRDASGQLRPLARMHGRNIVSYIQFSQMEDVLGHGGQLHSFEAVFSRRGEDGWPVPLWNRQTGEINPATAETWRRYDLGLLLRQNWESLRPKLQGKLHVVTGEEDTFFLEGSTRLLQETLQKLRSDAVVTLVPGRDHMNLYQGGLRENLETEMARKWLAAENRNLQKPE